ncbi:hypothetical protein [Brachyspira pilosicoli]|uniref:hypothetical protein n=1 Tax=Brachyspira pilosicoli TaxID=52584 RepID=UPI001CA4FB27|nr:hypothetical protein [Brachyspira pilosicoli]MBW5382311.1 hypothetical protein [Brachyspira pilosicoli]
MSNHYMCTKCGRVTVSTTRPLNGTCSKGGGHTWWKKPANAKSVRWQCKKCGRTTVSINHPLKPGCSKGGMHSWSKN